MKDMPGAHRTALLSLLRHARFKLKSMPECWAASKAFTDELDLYQAWLPCLSVPLICLGHKGHDMQD